MNIQFLNALALVFGIGAIILLALRLYAEFTYDEHEKIKDLLNGQVATFPILRPVITATVCAIWIITS